MIKIRKRKKAYTTVEIVLAAMIGTLFTALIAQSVLTVTSVTRDVTREALSESGVRTVIDLTNRYIRGAIAPADCQYPSSGVSAKDCYQFKERTMPAFVKASKNEIIFFGFSSTQLASKTFSPPDLIQVVGVPTNLQSNEIGSICVKVKRAPVNTDIVTSWRDITSISAAESIFNSQSLDKELCHQLLQGDTSSIESLQSKGCDLSSNELKPSDFFKFYNSQGVVTTNTSQIAYVSVNIKTFVSNSSKSSCPLTIKNAERLIAVEGELY